VGRLNSSISAQTLPAQAAVVQHKRPTNVTSLTNPCNATHPKMERTEMTAIIVAKSIQEASMAVELSNDLKKRRSGTTENCKQNSTTQQTV
jgi:hypothetical protein